LAGEARRLLLAKGDHDLPGQNPNLTGTGANSPVMGPWAYTEPDTRDIIALGYTYV
jgi:hypothetical protein